MTTLIKRFKLWIHDNPFYIFVTFIVIAVIGLFYAFMFSVTHFSETEKFQDISNLFTATIGIAVGLAGSVVAIILAVIALQMSQNQNRRELYDSVKEDVQKSFNIVYNVILAYKEVRYYMFASTIKFQNAKSQQEVDDCIKEVEEAFNRFSDAIKAIEMDFFTKTAYLFNFKEYKDFKYCNWYHDGDDKHNTDLASLYADAKKLTEMSLQIKTYSNHFIPAAIHEENIHHTFEDTPKSIHDGITLIGIGYCCGPAVINKTNKVYLVNTMVILDILYNLPCSDDTKRIINNNYNLDEKDSRFLDSLFISAVSDELREFREEIDRLRSFVHNNFEEMFIIDNK